MKKMLCIVCVLLFAISLSVSAEGELVNLVRNPGIEDGSDFWTLKEGTGSVDSEVYHSGAHSLKLEGSESRAYWQSADIPVDSSKVYTFSAYVKTDNVTTNSTATDKGVYMKIQRVDADGTNISGMQSLMSVSGTTDWTEYSKDMSVLFTDETAYIRIFFYIAAGETGNAWLDDVTLVQEYGSENLLSNSDFEASVTTSDWGAKQSGSCSIDSTVSYSGSNSYKFTNDTTQSYCYHKEVAVTAGKDYTLSARIKLDNVVAASDGYGARVRFQPIAGTTSKSMITAFTVAGTEDWLEYTYTYTPDTDVTGVRVYLYLGATSSGTAWFDDVTLSLKDDNYVSNAGFESATGTDNWAKLTDNATVDSANAYSGSRSLKISANTESQYVMSKLITVDPSKKYRLSAYIKTDCISTVDGAYMKMQQIGSENNSLGMGDKRIYTGGTSDWKRYTADIKTFNANTTQVRLYFYVDKDVAGNAWIDDIRLEEVNNVISITADTSTWATEDGVKGSITSAYADQGGVLIGTVYQNNQLVDLKMRNYSCVYGRTEEFSLPLTLPETEDYTVKFMLFNNLTGITPRCNLFNYDYQAVE